MSREELPARLDSSSALDTGPRLTSSSLDDVLPRTDRDRTEPTTAPDSGRKKVSIPSFAPGQRIQQYELIREAHRQGIVHRDLKPANIFATEFQTVNSGRFWYCGTDHGWRRPGI